jgi:hypothetical protein
MLKWTVLLDDNDYLQGDHWVSVYML